MGTKSNDQGRALEYIVCTKLASELKGAELTERAKKDNVRDKEYYDTLDENLRQDFDRFTEVAVKWLLNNPLRGKKVKLLDRFPDAKGIESDPTDIQLTLEDGKHVNLSIKNKHPALKHQRLPRLPEQCGVRDELVKKRYIAKHDKIWESFIEKSKSLVPNAKEFEEIKTADPTFIEWELYIPLTALVIEFLECHANNALEFFNFLTGKCNFYMLVNTKHDIEILDFTNTPTPLSMRVGRTKPNTLAVQFSNGWTIEMRLHTASKGMYRKNGKLKKSTKMDSKCPKIKEYVKCITLPK